MSDFKCLRTRGCRSPVACSGWGYCRERNQSVGGGITDSVVRKFRDEEKQRSEASATYRAALKALGGKEG